MLPVIESVQTSHYTTWVEIHLDHLLHNLRTLKKAFGFPNSAMAIVKANAYGHGLIEVAKTVASEVEYFGVSSLQDALALKEHQIEKPVFIFGRLLRPELPAALMNGIVLTVSSFEEAFEISELSETLSRKTTVHIKVDTGMGRLGIPYRQALLTIEKIAKLDGIKVEGLYTHFPTAELDDGFRDRQLIHFSQLVETLYKQGITFRYRHAPNSAGILKGPHPVINLIRPGIMLYGLYPDKSLTHMAQVKPVLSLKTRIISLKQLQAEESAGYGRSYIAKAPTNIAVLPIGYSHGYPFTASNKAYVLYHGKRYPLAGRVSMDYLTIDLGETAARIGDEVTLIGQDQKEKIRAEDLAQWAGTIPYEIVTRLIPTLPRIYK
ncbi:MAG: alanine racemase [Candidatus Omnitrophica bacterium]|nr:alanine racemase [Candidatus Omnitrophota bacterium]MDD5670095.1 alanine racemase [Candidatus Omnitrophota bacterium]